MLPITPHSYIDFINKKSPMSALCHADIGDKTLIYGVFTISYQTFSIILSDCTTKLLAANSSHQDSQNCSNRTTDLIIVKFSFQKFLFLNSFALYHELIRLSRGNTNFF